MAASRQRAQELIEEGVVLVDGVPATKSAAQVAVDRTVTLQKQDYQWVGRGALKLLGAIEPFGVDPAGLICADLGSSTGGFTEVLLQRGAQRVYAIDVGKGLLHYRLRDHERVVLMEGVNARHLESLPEPVDLVVGDLSFISIKLILPTILRLMRPGGQAVVLVKPQFEAGRKGVSKKGRIRSDADRDAAIAAVHLAAVELGFAVVGARDSTLPGAKAGNIEHFLHLTKPTKTEVD